MTRGTDSARAWGARFVAAALAACVLVPIPAQAVRRLALLVGNNDGGAGTRPLYYAHDDARRMREVLVRLGGVRPADAILLLDKEASDLVSALDAMEATTRAAQERAEVVVYYSGHAKDGYLRLGSTTLALDALRARLSAFAADVRIGILDSCRSGAVNRTKGARRAPAFDVNVGGREGAAGSVILTSSSGDEDAQESDHIGGSYFTHYFVGGLLGAADRSFDGKVTLSEAYAYAYERTVAATADTAAGPQHPTYVYDLAGNGDVVLTDVASRREGLALPPAAPEGTYYLVASGRVAAEVEKVPGEGRRIGLPPGRYTVTRRMHDRLRIGEVDVESGRVTTLDESRLADAPFSDDPVKGAGRAGRGTRWSVAATGGWLGFFRAPGSEPLFPDAMIVGLEIEGRGVFGDGWVLGLDVAGGAASGRLALEGLDTAYRARHLGAGAAILRTFDLGRFEPYVGVRMGYLFFGRELPDLAVADQFYSTFTPGLVVGSRLALGGHWHLAVRGRLHYLHYDVDEDRSLGLFDVSALVVHQR